MVLSTISSVGAEPLLSLDFDDREHPEPAAPQKGFKRFVINSEGSKTNIQTNATVRQFGEITVTLSDTLGTGYDDRHRNNISTTPEQTLLYDVIFPSGKIAGNALQLKIEGLSPQQIHHCTIWSYDLGSPGRRVSDWFANGELVKEQYEFDGNNIPASENEYRFEFDAFANQQGQLIIEGRRNSSSKNLSGRSDLGVFLNAVQIAKWDRTSRKMETKKREQKKAGFRSFGKHVVKE